MSITHASCLVCKSTDIEKNLELTDHFVSNEHFDIYRCVQCGFKFTQNIPSPIDIAPYYHSEDYISHSNIQKGLINRIYHLVRSLMLRRKLLIIKSVNKGKCLLDIGCGTGYFPYYMKEKGYDSYGMEIEPEARKFAAENFGVAVSSPDVLLNKKQSSKYDVITLWHVLEHLHDCPRYLEWIYDSLKDDGALFIALPNCNSSDAEKYKEYWAAYDVPRHLWHFTPDTLETYLKQFNFELKKIKRLPFDAYYNSLLSAKYQKKGSALIRGFFSGYLSNLNSLFNARKASSVIYILKKK